jgi:hypothetical protein
MLGEVTVDPQNFIHAKLEYQTAFLERNADKTTNKATDKMADKTVDKDTKKEPSKLEKTALKNSGKTAEKKT